MGRGWVWFFRVAAAVAKVAVQTALPTGSVVIFPRVLEILLHYNAGLVANIPVPMPLVIVITLIVLLGCVIWLRRAWSKEDVTTLVGLILILFGGVGNLTDRLADAHTTDYLLLFGHSVVNLSDGLVLAGIIYLAYTSLSQTKSRTFLPSLRGRAG